MLARFPEARVIAYADDGYIKSNLTVTLQVLVELKRVLKEDVVLELNVNKTTVLPKGVSQEAAFNAAHGIINTSLVKLRTVCANLTRAGNVIFFRLGTV